LLAQEPAADSAHDLFSSGGALEEVTHLLTCTAWDGGSKADLVAARVAITRRLGFEERADALVAEAQSARQDGANTAATADELDSYEALVRDAGKYSSVYIRDATRPLLHMWCFECSGY
jgi:hypothetical protein